MLLFRTNTGSPEGGKCCRVHVCGNFQGFSKKICQPIGSAPSTVRITNLSGKNRDAETGCSRALSVAAFVGDLGPNQLQFFARVIWKEIE